MVTLKGIPASPGIFEGDAVKFSGEESAEKVDKRKVLVGKKFWPDHTQILTKAGAIVVEKGGLLSHAAIIAREFGIPCVVGVEGISQLVKDGQVIRVNGDEGTVEVPGGRQVESWEGPEYIYYNLENLRDEVVNSTPVVYEEYDGKVYVYFDYKTEKSEREKVLRILRKRFDGKQVVAGRAKPPAITPEKYYIYFFFKQAMENPEFREMFFEARKAADNPDPQVISALAEKALKNAVKYYLKAAEMGSEKLLVLAGEYESTICHEYLAKKAFKKLRETVGLTRIREIALKVDRGEECVSKECRLYKLFKRLLNTPDEKITFYGVSLAEAKRRAKESVGRQS